MGKKIEFVEGKRVRKGKLAGFSSSRVIIVTQDNVEGNEVDPEDIVRIHYGQ